MVVVAWAWCGAIAGDGGWLYQDLWQKAIFAYDLGIMQKSHINNSRPLPFLPPPCTQPQSMFICVHLWLMFL